MFKKIICILILSSVSIFAEEKKVEMSLSSFTKNVTPLFVALSIANFYDFYDFKNKEKNAIENERNIYSLGILIVEIDKGSFISKNPISMQLIQME